MQAGTCDVCHDAAKPDISKNVYRHPIPFLLTYGAVGSGYVFLLRHLISALGRCRKNFAAMFPVYCGIFLDTLFLFEKMRRIV